MAITTTEYNRSISSYGILPHLSSSSTGAQESQLINATIPGNRLYVNIDGTIAIAPLDPAYAFGQHVVAPVLEHTPSLMHRCWSLISTSFQSIDRMISNIFTPFPVAAAESIPASSYAASSHCQHLLPENAVFKGGGAKGFVYPGVIKALEEMGLHSGIERVAGTSAGSIAGAFFAVGTTGDEMSSIFKEKTIIDFMHAEMSGKESSSFSQSIKVFSVGMKAFSTIQKAMGKKGLGALIEAWTDIINFKGLFAGDSFREWIDHKIFLKTGIKYCTFGELHDLIAQGKPYKRLYIHATRISGHLPESICFNAEDPEWRDLIISDAVLMSSALPGIIKVAVPHFKDSDGKRVPQEHLGLFVDGGLLNNLPIRTFDTQGFIDKEASPDMRDHFMVNKKTIAFNLDSSGDSKEPAVPKNLYQVAKALFTAIIKAQEIHHKSNAYDKQHRIVNIPTHGITTLNFWKGVKNQETLEESGYQATKSFIEHKMDACTQPSIENVDLISV